MSSCSGPSGWATGAGTGSGSCRAATAAPQLLAGQGFEALARDPKGMLVAAEIADGFELSPGDTLLPADPAGHRTGDTTAALPPAVVVPPGLYLARVVPGSAPGPVAAALRAGPLAEGYKVEQAGSSTVRGLTALNLAGLGRIESVGAVLIAAVGVAGLVALMVAASAVALGAALVAVDRVSAAAVLREQ